MLFDTKLRSSVRISYAYNYYIDAYIELRNKLFVCAGLEIATNTVAFATKFFPLRPKYLEKSQICDLLSPSLFRNKRVSSYHFAAIFAKINQ